MNKQRKLSWNKISKKRYLSKKFYNVFKTVLYDLGEVLFEMRRVKETRNYVINVFKTQGKWSGVKYDIYFDFEKGFYYSPRVFGKMN